MNHKGSTKPISFQGRKKKHDAKKHLKCTHCGMRYHEAKDCRIKNYQLRQIENAQKQSNGSNIKSTSTKAQKATAFSCEKRGRRSCRAPRPHPPAFWVRLVSRVLSTRHYLAPWE
ncbi:hypothetical protein V1505DRAFT_371448 [Lipomyces doorenjongii]